MADEQQPYAADDPNKPRDPALGLTTICGARTRAGGICNKPSMANGRCAMHGGKSPSGIKSATFKNGRFSKALKKLEADIGDRVNDPSLLDPRRTVAVQEGVMARLAEMVEERDSPEFREVVRKMLNEALEELKTNPADALQMLRRLQSVVNRGVDESRALMGMQQAAETLNRSQTRYWQTAMSAGRSIAPEEFLQLMFRMADIIEQETDLAAARRILSRADQQLCGGALGLAETPRTSGD